MMDIIANNRLKPGTIVTINYREVYRYYIVIGCYDGGYGGYRLLDLGSAKFAWGSYYDNYKVVYTPEGL